MDAEGARGRVGRVAEVLGHPDDSPLPPCHGVGLRIVFGKHGDEASFSHLSSPDQPWPFVAAADERLLQAGKRNLMELLDMIGFERSWVEKKIASGVEFRAVIFALEDCGVCVDPTWDNLLSFIRDISPGCADKLEPSIDPLKALSFAELVKLGNEVETLPQPEYERVNSFEAYAADGGESLCEARAFLRHTLKCTSLFTGDGYTTNEAGVKGAKEVLVRRCAIADLPGHRWIDIGATSSRASSGGAPA